MKFIKKTAKSLLRISALTFAVIYCYCLVKGLPFLSLSGSDDGITVTLVGNDLSLTSDTLADGAELISEAEDRAFDLVPEFIHSILEKLHALLNKFRMT